MTTRVPAVGRAAARLLARTYLAFVLGLVLWSLGPALLLGWQSTVVTSGSMAPLLPEGGVLVSSPTRAQDLVPGQVVLFADPARDGGLVSHRVVGRDDDGLLRTRGDANASTDSTPVADENVRAVGRLFVPWAGRPLLWVWQGQWLPLLTWSVLTAVAVLVAGRPHPGPGTQLLRYAWRTARTHGRANRLLAATGTTAIVVLAVAGNLGQPAPSASAGAGAAPAAGSLHSRFASLAAFTAPTTNPADQFALDASAQFGTSDYGAAVLADSPLIYYRLDEASGTTAVNAGTGGVADNGTYGTTQVAYNVTADATPREGGSAVTLSGTSGTNGCIIDQRLIAAPGPTQFSTELWFNTTSTAGGQLIGFGSAIGSNSGSNTDRTLYLTSTGILRFGHRFSGKLALSAPATYNDGRWHHVVATLGPAGAVLYVNGVAVASDATATTRNGSGYWHVGCDQLTGWPNLPARWLNPVTVDHVAVYPTVLTLTQVRAHYFGA